MHKQQKQKAMNKVITMVTTIILATSLSAFAANNDKPVTQKTSYEMSFTSVQVEDGIEIMLVESPEKSMEFEGTEANIARVNWTIKNGVLTVDSKKGSLKGRVKLIVNVSSLTDIYVKDGSEVRSHGQLQSASLKIHLDGDAFVAVKSAGEISVVKEDDIEMDIRRATGKVTFE